jgi:hypothetical protein
VTSNFEMRASGEGLVSLLACMMAILRMHEYVSDNVDLEIFLGTGQNLRGGQAYLDRRDKA